MKVKYIAYIAVPIIIAAAIYIGISAYMIMSQGINELVICANDKTLNVPFSESLCRSYLYSARGSARDIDILQQNGGVSFLMNAAQTAPERRKLVKFFIAKGLNINGPDTHGVLPLQLAVLEGSVGNIKLLLDFGANPLLAGKRISFTPLALAKKLQSENKLRGNGDAIVTILKAAVHAAQQVAPADRHPATRAVGG